jgi:hypothetical protein
MYPEIQVSLFKKEVNRLEGVVPLVEYQSYTFYLRNRKLRHLPAHFQIVRVQKENSDLLHDFVRMLPGIVDHTTQIQRDNPREEGHSLDTAIMSDIGALAAMLNANQMYMYALKRGDELFGLYWFKNAHVKWDTEDLGDTLHFVASYKNTENDDLFSLGFSHCLSRILREKRDYRMLMMDDIGHNGGVINMWRKTHDVIVGTDCAYYLYNWGTETVAREKCLVLL